MRRSVRLMRNTFFLSIAQGINPMLSMVLILLLSRRLGADGLGIYTTSLTLFSFFSIFSILGLHGPIVRDVAADRSLSGRLMSGAFCLGGVASILFAVLMLVASWALGYSQMVIRCIYLMAPALLFYTMSMYAQALLQAVERMEFSALILILETLTKVGLGIFAIVSGYGVVAVVGAVSVSHFIGMILGLVLIRRYAGPLEWKPEWASVLRLVKQIPTFLTLSIVVVVYWNTDILMLSKMKGTVDVGIYSAAYRLLSIGKDMANSYIVAIFPIISHFYVHSKNTFQISCTRSIKYLFMLTLPVAILITIRAEDILLLLYKKEEFAGAVSTLQVIIWTMVFFPIANILGNGLIASHRQRIDLLINLLSASFNVVLNLLLIPRYGSLGAGIATLASILFFLLVQNFYVSRVLFAIPFWDVILKPLAAAVVMSMILLTLNWNLFLVAPFAMLVYLGCLWAMRSFAPEEIALLRSIWNERGFIYRWRHS